MKQIYYSLLLVFSTTLSFGQANYLVENFDYPSGTLLTANGWFQHGTSAVTPSSVNSAGLSWATYIGSGIGNAALVANTGQDVNRPLAGFLSEGSVYASFLFRPSAAVTSTATGNYFFHFLKYSNETTPDFSAISSAHRARVFVLQGTNSATQFKLGLNFNAASFISPSNVTADLNINTTYLVVVKYTFVAGLQNDTVSMYVFTEGQDISTEPATPTLGPFTATLTGTAPNQVLADDLNIIQGVALRQDSNGQNAIVDGIYVRNQWNLTSAGSPLSNASFTKEKFSVYPNPVRGNQLNVSSLDGGLKTIVFFDSNGRKVLEQTTEGKDIDVSALQKGFYIIQITADNAVQTNKIIIE